MTSIIKADNISTVAGTGTITIPSGVKIVGTDAASIVAPGSIIQTISGGAFTSTVSVSSTTFIGSGHIISIIPKQNNSKFLIRLSGGGWYDNSIASNTMWVTFYRSINGSAYSSISGIDATYGLLRMSGDGNTWNIKPYSAEWLDTTVASAGDNVSYQVYVRVNANSSQYNASDRGTPVLIIQEIAQ